MDARARAEALRERLGKSANPSWDPLESQAADTLYQEGMALYRDEYFGDAAAKFQAAIKRLQDIEQRLQDEAAQRLADAEAALRQEDFAAAESGYQAVLSLLPDSQQALDGLATAKQGMAAGKLLDEARQAIDQGNLQAAASQLDAMPSGVLTDGVRKARRQIAAARQRHRLNRSMSKGFRHLDRGEWSAAKDAFTEALRADPKSTAAKDALEDVRRRQTDDELAALRAEADAQLEAENWQQAHAVLERMRELDPGDSAIPEDLARIGRLMDIEQRLDGYLDQPQRLTAKGVREQALALAAATADPQAQGARITQKRARLLQALDTWTTPVDLTIRSDNRTEVRIRPGRVLGKFKERRLQVFPGDYVLGGRRVGYREVSLKIAVSPGADAFAVEVVCNEPF